MRRKEFERALAMLGACISARHDLHGNTLRHFWLNSEQADWMLWLIVRVGLWGRVSRYARPRFSPWDAPSEPSWWARQSLYERAGGESCSDWLYTNPADHRDHFRKRVSVEDLTAAIRKTIEREGRRG